MSGLVSRGRAFHLPASTLSIYPSIIRSLIRVLFFIFQHRTFTHVMDMVKQDYYAVASLLEHVLASLRVQLPEVDEAFLRSDNAACYHSGFLWTILPDISSRTGNCNNESSQEKVYLCKVPTQYDRNRPA